MSTATRAVPFYLVNLAESRLRLVHLRRRRAELARAGAPWRDRLAVVVALAASRVEVAAFSRLAHSLEGVAR